MGTPSRTTAHRRPRSSTLLAVATTLTVLLLAGCSSSGTSGPSGTSTSTTARAASSTPPSSPGAGLAPTAVPATGAYLGAWVHPEAATSGSSFAVEQAALPDGRSRPPVTRWASCTCMHRGPDRRRWRRCASVAAAGSIPLLDWGCGPDVAQLVDRGR